MPKLADEKSAIALRNLGKGLHAVGGVSGLLLRVTPSGAGFARSWVLRVRVWSTGKRRDVGLGPYPEVSLAAARDKARAIKEQIRGGADPVDDRRHAKAAIKAEAARTITFAEAARRMLADKAAGFGNAKHAAQWRTTLETYAGPVMGDLPVAAVELAHVLAVLKPNWQEKVETMKRLRGRIESVLAWAAVHGYRSGDNPARWKGNLDAILPKPSKVATVEHHKALPWRELPQFMSELRERDGAGARALELAILTAARSGEVRGAAWSEFDIARRLWVVPAARMKAGREHRVPLSDAAVALLEALDGPRDGLVFSAPRGGELSDMALSAVCRRMAVEAVPHGFRSTFRSWCAEQTRYPREVAELALAHHVGSDVERAYQRADLVEKRRQLMTDWARHCAGLDPVGGEVLALVR